MANQIDKENKLAHNDDAVEYARIAPDAIVERDPTFKPDTMFGMIAKSANEGYNEEDPSDEIGQYAADAKALRSLAEANPDIASSSRLLSTLNKISKESVSCYKTCWDIESFEYLASEIIPAYAQCKYDTPKKAETALKNIAEITECNHNVNPDAIIGTVQTIVNSSEISKDAAEAALKALDSVSRYNKDNASKLLPVYNLISQKNPESAQKSIKEMVDLFERFPEHFTKTNDAVALKAKHYSSIRNHTGTAEELWDVANQLARNDKNLDYMKDVSYAIVERDPTFKPQIMFNTIASMASEGHANEENSRDEIKAYTADAKALRSLAEHNPDIASSSRLLSTLNHMSKDAIGCYGTWDKFAAFATEIMPAYAQCKYDTPKQAETALKNIAEITKNLDDYNRNSPDVLNAVHAIVNSSEISKDGATAAFSAVHLVSPQNSEEASKLLSVYKNISLGKPELAGDSAREMCKIFKAFPDDEKLQKECLSTLQTLNSFRSRFDEDTQKNFDSRFRLMKCHIDAEELKRRKGEETTWKAPNSERRSTNTQSYSNFGNTYTGR